MRKEYGLGTGVTSYFGQSVKASLTQGHMHSSLQDTRDKLCTSGEIHSRDQVEGSSNGNVLLMETVARLCG